MEKEILNAILSSYSKILNEISDIKRMLIEDKKKDKVITCESNKNISDVNIKNSVPIEINQEVNNKITSNNMINNLKSLSTNNSTITSNNIPNNINKAYNNIPTNNNAKISNKISTINNINQFNTQIENTKNLQQTLIPSTIAPKKHKHIFDPKIGVEYEKCFSQGIPFSQAIPNKMSSKSQYFIKKSYIQEKCNFNKNEKIKWEFFDLLEKETEEAL